MQDENPKRARVVDVVAAIDSIDAASWDACAGSADPFVSHAFLRALENSGSATAETGWRPQHLVVRGDGGQIDAVAPLYVKAHSYGEYVFDWSWASAYERAGGRYYPKLQCCVPFTPVPGSRLLVRDTAHRSELRKVLVTAMHELGERHELSSVHVSFLLPEEQACCEDLGFLARTGIQYHWHNRGYASFDEFLAALVSRKRKAIRRERREAAASGLRLVTLTGDSILPSHWDAFDRFYRDTTSRKWAEPYLNKDFFCQLGETMPERVVLMLAEQDGQWVAGALHMLGQEALYGRYWGTLIDRPFLHFELCYYRAIEFAIEHGLDRVEAGAQGEHKISRGYLPQRTHSVHSLANLGFSEAVEAALERESCALDRQEELLLAQSPYREDDGA
ncbi:MAG: GNAT family N-acetyltransferase [Polyangiaceae bacterium]